MKIKIFKTLFDDDDVSDFENEVNEWIISNNIEIKEFKQSYNSVDDGLSYTILYYEKKELRKVKIDKINEL